MSFQNIFSNSISNNDNQKKSMSLYIPSINKFGQIDKSKNQIESGKNLQCNATLIFLTLALFVPTGGELLICSIFREDFL